MTGSWSDGGVIDGELLAGAADRLRWRAPELALEFARQAAALAGEAQDKALGLRANALVVAALVRLGKHAEAVEPAVLALREAEETGARELAGSLRVDLAASARAVGLAGSALVIVRPLLDGGDTRPALRAGALAEIVGGLALSDRQDRAGVVDEVLSEADRLYAADETLAGDVRRVLRALLCARVASFRRRWGNATGAVAAATEGMALLDGLADPSSESGQARAELGLEMVCALLDAGETAAALGQAEQTLKHPIRATTAAAIGRLMFVLATRVHVPDGRAREAHEYFAEIVRISRRHELDTLLTDVHTALAHEQEAVGALTEALESLRSARAAEHRRLRADTLARMVVLEELGAGTSLPDDTEGLLRRIVRSPARTFPELPERAGPGRSRSERLVSDWAASDRAVAELLGTELGGSERSLPERSASELAASSYAVGEPRWPGQAAEAAETGQSAKAVQSAQAAQSARTAESAQEETDPGRDGDPGRQSLRRRLAAARRQTRPTALTLVRLEPSSEPDPEPEHNRDPDSTDRFSASLIRALGRAGPEVDPDVLDSLAGHVRDMAPDDAELVVRPEDGELAVLLPDTTRDEAEQFAASVRETVSTSDWDLQDPARGVQVSTGVAQYQEGTTEDALLTAAREALTSTEPETPPVVPDWQSVEPGYNLPVAGYSYIEEYDQRAEAEPADEEMAAYLAGFSLPDYRQWPPAEQQEPQAARHDAAATTDEGQSVLDKLGIAKGAGGGRRRAPDSFEFERPQPQPEPRSPQQPPPAGGRRRKPDDEDPYAREKSRGNDLSPGALSGMPSSGTVDEILAAAAASTMRASSAKPPPPAEIPGTPQRPPRAPPPAPGPPPRPPPPR
ncbi:MAG: diguanylate cyclase, partial [Kibdelosporangium sp.]